MRSRHRQNRYYDTYDNRQVIAAENITINNITNIAYLPTGTAYSKHHRHPHRKRRDKIERKPDLLPFYTSCGIVDRDKVMRISDEELFKGTSDVVGYAVRDVGRNMRGAGKSIAQMGGCMCDLVGNLFGMVSELLK